MNVVQAGVAETLERGSVDDWLAGMADFGATRGVISEPVASRSCAPRALRSLMTFLTSILMTKALSRH